MLDAWGEGMMIDIFAPTIADSAVMRSAWALFERAAASPGMVRGVWEAARRSTRGRCCRRSTSPRSSCTARATGGSGSARALHGRDDPRRPLRRAAGDDHTPWFGDSEPLLEEIEEFLTGTRQGTAPDRVLATVLFTDIVGSTERAAELGDRRWRELLEGHDQIVRAQLGRFGGREVNTTGDGFLAAFEGPARAIECAQAINEELEGLDVEVRAGIHTGECERRGEDLGGLAVHIGARVGARAQAGEVLVSSTVKELVVGSGIAFDDRRHRGA